MPELPIRRMMVYKHGVGYFERRGAVNGAELRLTFPREAMDDVLKSLVVLDLGTGQVLGVDFETPEDRAAQIARGSIHLSDNRSLLDLLRDLRGRRVRLAVQPDRRTPAETSGEVMEGLVIGVDLDDAQPLRAPMVSLYMTEQREVRAAPIGKIMRLDILDDRAAGDLGYFLRASQSEEDRRIATLRLSEGEHDLLVSYIAPAPAWRVSYRLLAEPTTGAPGSSNGGGSGLGAQVTVLIQGWGMFDNQLDEDLEHVELTLVAGMPVSFRYRLYEPHTPDRPFVEDEERTVATPVEFAAFAAAPAPAGMAAPKAMRIREEMADVDGVARAERPQVAMAAMERSTQAASTGEERGALFQYRVAHPVSVARGQSAMAPIVSRRLDGRRELLYNGRKLPRHPVASLRMRNETGLTLERGPVTVLEHGDYAGEAVLPFTRAGAEIIVAYAVELGVTVREERRADREMAGLGIRDEYLLIEEWDVQRTLYRLVSSLPDATDIVIEQDLLASYDLVDTPAPAEQAQGAARWAVHCPPGVETTFNVSQRRKTMRSEQVRTLDKRRLSSFLRGKYLDEATYRALDHVLALYDQAAQRQKELQRIEQERQKIYARQQQTQGNLGPLGREGNEQVLRERYVALLGELEDRLNQLTADEQSIHHDIERLEREASQALAALSQG
ncbi:MAG: hypothetical protein HXY39_08490 [Chloroflexi bacterium]|nr:hypothetical protein [Chloroflexota bacterium]